MAIDKETLERFDTMRKDIFEAITGLGNKVDGLAGEIRKDMTDYRDRITKLESRTDSHIDSEEKTIAKFGERIGNIESVLEMYPGQPGKPNAIDKIKTRPVDTLKMIDVVAKAIVGLAIISGFLYLIFQKPQIEFVKKQNQEVTK